MKLSQRKLHSGDFLVFHLELYSLLIVSQHFRLKLPLSTTSFKRSLLVYSNNFMCVGFVVWESSLTYGYNLF